MDAIFRKPDYNDVNEITEFKKECCKWYVNKTLC